MLTAGAGGVFYQKSIEFMQPGHYGLRFTLVAPEDDLQEGDDSTRVDTDQGDGQDEDDNDNDDDNEHEEKVMYEWAWCELCSHWRVLEHALAENAEFVCQSIGRVCGQPTEQEIKQLQLLREHERHQKATDGKEVDPEQAETRKRKSNAAEAEAALKKTPKKTPKKKRGRPKRSLKEFERGKPSDSGPSPKFRRVGKTAKDDDKNNRKRKIKWNVEPHYTVVSL